MNCELKEGFCIDHPIGISLNSSLIESDVRSLPGVKERDMYNGWVWYDLPEAEILGKNVIFNISFFKENIRAINVSLVDPEVYGSGWDEWSEKKELLRVRHIKEWLTSAGYEPGEYTWGEVWAGYDSKGGQGYGSIRFPENK